MHPRLPAMRSRAGWLWSRTRQLSASRPAHQCGRTRAAQLGDGDDRQARREAEWAPFGLKSKRQRDANIRGCSRTTLKPHPNVPTGSGTPRFISVTLIAPSSEFTRSPIRCIAGSCERWPHESSLTTSIATPCSLMIQSYQSCGRDTNAFAAPTENSPSAAKKSPTQIASTTTTCISQLRAILATV